MLANPPTPTGMTTDKPLSNLAMSRLPALSVLGVFSPVLLTALLFRVLRLVSEPLFASLQTYPLMGFVVYVASVWVVIGLGWSCLRGRGVTWRDLGFTNFHLRDLAWAAGAASVAVFIAFPASQLLSDLLRLAPIRGMNYRLDNPTNAMIAVLVCTLSGPLGEEILYRGFLLGLLWAKLGRAWPAGVLGTLIFAVLHVPGFGLRGALYILFSTPLLVTLFLWRRSVYPPYAMHVINNTFAYVLVPLLFA